MYAVARVANSSSEDLFNHVTRKHSMVTSATSILILKLASKILGTLATSFVKLVVRMARLTMPLCTNAAHFSFIELDLHIVLYL